ncbi:MAG TPA: hypothetical protein VJB67_02075 [Patescibacteria group bacterium]|nr:hypothetical protein [Patescibacteria group bacterium]
MTGTNLKFQKMVLFFSLLVLVCAPITAQALANIIPNLDNAAGDLASGEPDLTVLIGNLVSIVLGFLGIIMVLLIIYGGYLWMTSQGDSAQVEKAKTLIKNAIIGVAIILLSYIITHFVIISLQGAMIDGGTAA